MTEQVSGRLWTEIEWVVLEPSERSDAIPSETRRTAYVARVRGMASAPRLDALVEVETVTGRRLRGKVVAINPGYSHTFGSPQPEWIRMRDAVRSLRGAANTVAELAGESK